MKIAQTLITHTTTILVGILTVAALSGCATSVPLGQETAHLSNAVRPAHPTVDASNMSNIQDGSGRPLAAGAK